jgi:hypothetical protein
MAAGAGLSPQVIGRLGELAVEMELLKGGWSVGNYNASTKNAETFDLFASKGKRRIGIRVKAYKGNRKRKGEGVQYTAKDHGSVFNELDSQDDGDFVVIVRVCPQEPEEFYIIPTKIVDCAINDIEKKWRSHPKKDGSPRKVTTHRIIDFHGEQNERQPYRGYQKIWKEYMGDWKILEESL